MDTSERERLRTRRENLWTRGRALAAIRAFFDGRGYLEVETPLLVPSPGMELHLRAIPAGGGYLNTSPEYQMKRLLAAGLERIYQLSRAFRAEERGAHHVSEFTLLEWYRVGARLPQLMEETEQLLGAVAERVVGRAVLPGVAGEVELAPGWDRLTVTEAFQRFGGLQCDGTESGGELAARARAAGWDVPEGVTDWDEVFTRVFVDAIEPHLGRRRPVFLHRWPARQAALSRLCPEDPRFAERFEVFAGGLELANAFEELTDCDEQRRRLVADQALRRARGLDVYPVDERFLGALAEGIPPVSGIALGVDRLVMLLCGARRIDDVLAFTPEEL